MIKLRRAKRKDVNAVFSLGKKTPELNFQKNIHFHEKSELLEWVKHSKDNVFIVAECEKKIVGFLYAKIVSHDWCILDNIAVLPSFRGNGVGRLLLNYFYNVMKQNKVTYVGLLVEPRHKKAISFWEKNNFKRGKNFIWYGKKIK